MSTSSKKDIGFNLLFEYAKHLRLGTTIHRFGFCSAHDKDIYFKLMLLISAFTLGCVNKLICSEVGKVLRQRFIM